MFKKFCMFCMFYFVSMIANAEESEKTTVSLGAFANDLTPRVGFLGNFITTGSLILGVICFFWGFNKFLEYKQNPYTTTLSSVMAVILPAIAFVCLPFLSFIIGVEINPLQK